MLEVDAERGGERAGLQARAPDQRVGLDDLARLERDPRRLDRLDHLAQLHLDAAVLQGVLGVGPDVLLEHGQELRAGLDQDDARLVLGDPGVVLGEVAAVQLGQRPGALDARGPAADDDHVERPVGDERGVAVRRLPLPQDVVLHPHRVGERVHREAVLGRPLHPEELSPGAQGQDEVVVAQRRPVRERDLAPVQVDARHLGLVDRGVRVLVEQVAEGVADRGRLQQVGGDLVQERLERVVVVVVDDRDVDVRPVQLAGGADAPEPAAEHEYVGSAGVGRGPGPALAGG